MQWNPYTKKKVRKACSDKRQERSEAVKKLDLDRANYTGAF